MQKGEIKQRLNALPPTAAAAFAARVAMRWLPFLSAEQTGILARMGLKRQPIFYYWKEASRQPFLLAVLRAQVGTVGVALGSVIARKAVWVRRKAVTIAADAAAAADAHADAAAYAASDAAYAATAAYAAVEVSPGNASVYDAVHAAFAAVGAAERIYTNFNAEEHELISLQYEFDLQILEKQSIADFLNSPLWQVSGPVSWQERWALFVKNVLALEPSFAVWLEWIEARIAGQPIDLILLEQWLALPAEIEAQSTAAINQYLVSLGSGQMSSHAQPGFSGGADAGNPSLIAVV